MLEFVVERGGTDIVAMGHTEVVKLYESNGLKVFHEAGVQHGQTVYFDAHERQCRVEIACKKIEADREDEAGDDACYHGGQSWEASSLISTYGIRSSWPTSWTARSRLSRGA